MSVPNTFNMVDEALHLAGQGFRVFPVSRSKVPFKGSHGYLDATTDPATIEAMWRRRPRADIAIATGEGLVVLDVDGPRGIETLSGLIAEHGPLPATLRAKSGRLEGGQHAYYRVEGKVANSAGGGLEIRGDGGYVVAPPSLHKSGRRYEWVNQLPIADAPAWLYELGGRPRQGGERKQNPKDDRLNTLPVWLRSNSLPPLTPEIIDLPEIEDLAACVALIPNKDREWEDWNRIGMAIWAASGGAEYGREAWLAFSRLSDKFDEERTLERWCHYAKSPPTSIGFGSLVFEAREVDPTFELPSSRGDQVESKLETRSDPPNESQVNGHHFPFEEDSDPKAVIALNDLNKRYSVIGDIGGKCLVMAWVPSKAERGVKIPTFQSFKSFSEFHNNRYIKIRVEKNDSIEEKSAQLGSYWLKWRKRKSYQGIDLSPNPAELPEGYLNLWSGFAVDPAPGDWSLLKKHILDVLAQGDRPSADYIARFAAWGVQHPGERAEVALVFKGDKGSGKGTFANALRRLFGAHGLQIYNPKHLVGAFNAHLRNCLLLFSDEAFWAGDKQGESTLKGMITEPALVIEQKGVDAIAWRNRLKVIMSANADWVVPASHEERRYAVFEVSGDRIGDKEYFKALHAQINAGGLSAMLHELKELPLHDWHPRDIPHTTALREQKARSMKPLDAWWEFLLQEGILPFQWHGGTNKGLAAAILGHLRENAPRTAEVSAYALAKYLEGIGCTGKHEHQGKIWTFPNLAAARKRWEIKWGAWIWREQAEDWGKYPDYTQSPSPPSPVRHDVSL